MNAIIVLVLPHSVFPFKTPAVRKGSPYSDGISDFVFSIGQCSSVDTGGRILYFHHSCLLTRWYFTCHNTYSTYLILIDRGEMLKIFLNHLPLHTAGVEKNQWFVSPIYTLLQPQNIIFYTTWNTHYLDAGT